MKKTLAAHKGNKYEGVQEKKIQKTLETDGVSPRIRQLYARSLTIVSREIGHLRKLCIVNKLGPNEASDLAMYVKLLGEVVKHQREVKRAKKEEESEFLQNLNDEEFQKLIKGFLEKPKQKK